VDEVEGEAVVVVDEDDHGTVSSRLPPGLVRTALRPQP